MPMAAFILQWQSCVTATKKTTWPTKQNKIFDHPLEKNLLSTNLEEKNT